MPQTHELHLLLGEISSDVKHILAKQSDQSDRIDHLSKRLNVLENARSKIYGALAVIPVVFSAALYVVKTQL